jgi:hypothetical protein
MAHEVQPAVGDHARHNCNSTRAEAMADYAIPEDDEINAKFIDDLARLEQALRLRVGYRVHDLRLEVEPHGLVLTGHASSYYDKQLAQQIVKELCDLPVVENRIVVDLPSTGSCLEERSASENYRIHHRKLHRPDLLAGHTLAVSQSYFYAR